MDDLLSGAAKIDARTLADLLDYFVQLSRHINYYDFDLNISDWKPFFKNSIPFTLSSVIKYPINRIENNFILYNSLFDKKPSSTGLQLISKFLFYDLINKINDWYITLKGSNLPIEAIAEVIIKNKLQDPLKKFIQYENAAVKSYKVNRIDFTKLIDNKLWNIDLTDLYSINNSFSKGTSSKFKRINNLYNDFKAIFPVFLDAVKILSAESEKNLEQSFIPLKEELQKKHQPQLALLFAFLNMFRQLQGDLNKYTRKHLDFFYKDILLFKAGEPVPDKTHVVFEIQKALKDYLLKKGLLVKDGKDDNKQDILFSLDDEIVITKTSLADKRTLFLNNQDAYTETYVEGVYIAPVAEMADGVDKDFKDDPKNFPTLGAKYSKYIDPETKLIKPYPNARLGFILGSPVLFLQEGSTRTIEINLDCYLDESLCSEIAEELGSSKKNCCDDNNHSGAQSEKETYPNFYNASSIYNDVNNALSKTYYYFNQDLLKQAIKKGISSDLIERLRDKFLLEENKSFNKKITQDYCNCPVKKDKYEGILDERDYSRFFAGEKELLSEWIKPRRALNILFSGEKEWLQPSIINKLELIPASLPMLGPGANQFTLHITATLNPDKEAVTFYDKEKLKEDFDTTQPLVKIELDDKIKLIDIELKNKVKHKEKDENCCVQTEDCCLLKDEVEDDHEISLYHFFRNVLVDKIAPADQVIKIDVCGLKNFIVQNDESVMDVNGQIYPFGTRPDIVDFNIINPSFCITQNFINDAFANGISNNAKSNLQHLLSPANGNKVRISKATIEAFLNQQFNNPAHVLTNAEKTILRALIDDPTKNYCNENLRGPNFYIGSNEVFCKKWSDVFVNLNWKDKPSDFRDYYKGYIAKIDPNDSTKFIYGLDKDEFQINLSILKDGTWNEEGLHAAPIPDATAQNIKTGDNNRKLFPNINATSPCTPENPFEQTVHLQNSFFNTLLSEFELDTAVFGKYDVNSRKGFLRVNLQNQDFLHKNYAYVLARQMMALGKLPDNKIDDAVYYDSNGGIIVFSTNSINNEVIIADTLSGQVRGFINVNPGGIKERAGSPGSGNIPNSPFPKAEDIRVIIYPDLAVNNIPFDPQVAGGKNLTNIVRVLKDKIEGIKNVISNTDKFQAIIPNEPWTPTISNMSLDYKAVATIEDINLIHLYPYITTYKHEEIELQPTLFPTFCDEGTLFLGLKDLVPGDNLNILFQLAEATSDSESEKEDVFWYYLDSNVWKPLRKGFEVIDDATKNLTTSGVVKLSLPANMTKDNTVMPKDLHWIKAAIAKNSKAVSETTGIHPQAIRVTFTDREANDKLRLAKPLPEDCISKLNEADASVKSVLQPYESFGGLIPEMEGQFYVRVSEHLRHKGRAIQAFDYERLVLQAFPQLFKVKCINHSFALDAHKYIYDFPYAPGYVILAVIPDLNKLKAGNSFEPKVPVSIIEDIDAYVRKRTSPFVRFRTMNPRYEKINFCLRVQLVKGKDENYYREQLKQDIREFLAPWAVGDYYKLTFGQCVYRSDIIQLLETKDYVDFITDLRMGKENEVPNAGNVKVCPDTPRSIFIAGDIEACIEKPECESWNKEYKKCDETLISPCDTKTEPIIKYYKCEEKEKMENYGR